jgi:Membrane iron-sulfur containing protein FtrD-like
MARHRRTTKLTWRETSPIWATLIVLFAIGAFGLWLFVPVAPRIRTLALSEDAAVPLGNLELKTPVMFAALLPSGQSVEFFIERESGDSVTVAFASCRRCYGAGHYSQAGQVICKRCNQPMPRFARGEVPGAEKDCKHVPIPFERSGGNVIVRAQAIADVFARWYASVIAENPANAAGDGK